VRRVPRSPHPGDRSGWRPSPSAPPAPRHPVGETEEDPAQCCDDVAETPGDVVRDGRVGEGEEEGEHRRGTKAENVPRAQRKRFL
jgi:hypothetical protein